MTDKKESYTYTQEQWNREIGYGKVPGEYKKQVEANGTSTNNQRKQSK